MIREVSLETLLKVNIVIQAKIKIFRLCTVLCIVFHDFFDKIFVRNSGEKTICVRDEIARKHVSNGKKMQILRGM